jgi:sulfatase modifying factor 1
MDPDKNASSCGGTGRGERRAQQRQKACCAPAVVRDHSSVMPLGRQSAAGLKSAFPLDNARPMVSLSGGTFLMGTEYLHGFPQDGEGLIRPVTLSPFQIDTRPVTNEDFADLVAATGYRTEAERFGLSFVFWAHIPKNRFSES